MEHDMHCFDSIRQHVMCAADENLLATTGHNDLGKEQVRMCKNWDLLREWATERTACYHDCEPPACEPEDRWNHCDDGLDGLPRGSLLDDGDFDME